MTDDPERDDEAALAQKLEIMARASSEAEVFLGAVASSLFPPEKWDIAHLTWPERRREPSERGAGRHSWAPQEAAATEAKLRAAEARYRTLVEQIPAVTFMAVLGEGTNEVYVSPHIETMLGFTQKEWLENPFLWYSQLHPGDRGLWHDVFAKGCHTGGPFRADCRFIARDGREVFVHGEARLVKDDIGRPLFLQGIAFDITEIREAQEKAVRAEKLATIGQFAASVGHDLRNPLAAVRNAGTYIAKRITGSALEREDPRIRQFLALMDRELNACTKIIADLLDFARERSPALIATSLRALVAEAMVVVQAPSTVTLANEVPEGLPSVDLDRDQFRQVIVNLVQNAAEAMPAGRTGSVRVTGATTEREVVLQFVDDGAGMAPNVQRRIFEPLFTTKMKGTGLGLAIVASIVHRHHGIIEVTSTANRGSTFTIRLPLRGGAVAPHAPALAD